MNRHIKIYDQGDGVYVHMVCSDMIKKKKCDIKQEELDKHFHPEIIKESKKLNDLQ